jgi:LEA14-like dessication related protein
MTVYIRILLASLLLCGCASLRPGLESPEIKLVHLKALAVDGFQQRFAVGLLISNPNATDIALRGMSYRIGLAGHDIFSGVASEVPVLVAYQETPVTVEVSASLISVLALMGDLARSPAAPLTYHLSAKLDVGRLLPAIRIEEAGPLPFSQLRGLTPR